MWYRGGRREPVFAMEAQGTMGCWNAGDAVQGLLLRALFREVR